MFIGDKLLLFAYNFGTKHLFKLFFILCTKISPKITSMIKWREAILYNILWIYNNFQHTIYKEVYTYILVYVDDDVRVMKQAIFICDLFSGIVSHLDDQRELLRPRFCFSSG